MTGPRNVMLIGGPSSGKSNYLFRAWIAIERETGQIRKAGLPADLDYLHDGTSHLLSGRFAPHTSMDTFGSADIPIRLAAAGEASSLYVPDVSGEMWDAVYLRREWPIAWDSYVAPNTGFVLFIRAGSAYNVRPMDWLTSERLYRTRASEETRVPTQVLLVDWLQTLRTLIAQRIATRYAPRLSIVITAWDTVDHDYGPNDYLRREFPLLAQYLAAGLHGFDDRAFGVSIVGGDLNDEAFRSDFIEGDPIRRGFCATQVKRGVVRHSDVLLPLYWALGVEAAE